MSRKRLYHTEAERKHANIVRQRAYRKLHHVERGPPHVADRSREPVPDEVMADAIFRNSMPHASVTAAICGDPKPGQSALDKRKG